MRYIPTVSKFGRIIAYFIAPLPLQSYRHDRYRDNFCMKWNNIKIYYDILYNIVPQKNCFKFYFSDSLCFCTC
jgi:hypothetical protein